jgi:hypothetical protein
VPGGRHRGAQYMQEIAEMEAEERAQAASE